MTNTFILEFHTALFPSVFFYIFLINAFIFHRRTIDTLDDPLQRDFIAKCLASDPAMRPSARELLFHPLLFEVHSLKLLAAHVLVNTSGIISIVIYNR